MKIKILVALQSFGQHSDIPLKLLKNSGAEVIFNDLKHRLTREEIIKLGNACDGIIAGVEPYDKPVLDKLEKIKCLSRCGVGIDNIDCKIAEERKIKILNTPNVVVQPVAEMVIAMAFDLLRLLTLNTNNMRSGKWEKKAGHLLQGRKVGIVGLGRIGKRVAELFKALGAIVYGFDIYPDQNWLTTASIELLPIEELFKIVDIVSFHVSISNDNPFIMNKKYLDLMKPGSLLINTSRGSVIDEADLFSALKSNHLAGAGLDVFSKEPYDGELTTLQHVVITPHVSTLTQESRAQMEIEATENIINFFKLPMEK